MDKKQAEDVAIRKAKEVTHAAGKNTGMSGRDLVRLALSLPLTLHSRLRPCRPWSIVESNLIVLSPQFTFNPEWFEEEEEEEDDWDLEKYRKQKEEEDEAAEVERIRQLQSQDGGGEST